MGGGGKRTSRCLAVSILERLDRIEAILAAREPTSSPSPPPACRLRAEAPSFSPRVSFADETQIWQYRPEFHFSFGARFAAPGHWATGFPSSSTSNADLGTVMASPVTSNTEGGFDTASSATSNAEASIVTASAATTNAEASIVTASAATSNAEAGIVTASSASSNSEAGPSSSNGMHSLSDADWKEFYAQLGGTFCTALDVCIPSSSSSVDFDFGLPASCSSVRADLGIPVSSSMADLEFLEFSSLAKAWVCDEMWSMLDESVAAELRPLPDLACRVVLAASTTREAQDTLADLLSSAASTHSSQHVGWLEDQLFFLIDDVSTGCWGKGP